MRKKKTPKSSSSRAFRTQNSGHSSSSSSWYDSSGGVMSSVACGSPILLGMYWLVQHSANSVLNCAYSWSYGVKVATSIWTWWKTRVVLPMRLGGSSVPCSPWPAPRRSAEQVERHRACMAKTSAAHKRKRKKRRKKKTPQTSPHSPCIAALVVDSGSGMCKVGLSGGVPRAVFPSSVLAVVCAGWFCWLR